MKVPFSLLGLSFAALALPAIAHVPRSLSRSAPSIASKARMIRPWPGKEHSIDDIAVTVSGPLVQCQDVVVSWADKRIPKGKPYHFNVWATITWTHADGNGNPTGENTTSGVYFVTPGMDHKWLVDFPAGATVTFEMNSWSSSVSLHGRSEVYTIQPSDSSECIPAAHYPIIMKVPQDTAECGVSRLSWTGGSAPFTVYIRSMKFDVFEMLEAPVQQDEDGVWYVDWLVDYPIGSAVGIGVWSEDASFMTEHIVTIQNRGASAACIPRHHRKGYRRWFQHPGAITGFIIGGIVVLAGLGLGGWKGYQYYKNREGAIQLE